MTPDVPLVVENGRMGRVAYGRIAPNEDLVHSIEQLCMAQGFEHAFVRGSLGSLTQAGLARLDGSCSVVHGLAIEIVGIAGEVRRRADGGLRAELTGVVVDVDGKVHGGRFVHGANPVCVTCEVTVEEWLPAPQPERFSRHGSS